MICMSISMKMKGVMNSRVARSALMYSAEIWAVMKAQERKRGRGIKMLQITECVELQ